jgi:sulfotransferase family protein
MIKLAYILAASHSGSTLLSMLLGSHVDSCTVGETKLSVRAIGDLDRYRCSCGEFIQNCSFWRQVQEGMDRRGFQFDLADGGTDYQAVGSSYARRLLRPLHRGVVLECVRDVALKISTSWRNHLADVQGKIAAFLTVVSEIRGAKVVIDSSKTAVRLKYLLRNSDLEIKVIRLIRDGRAVALTYMNPEGFADSKDENFRGGGSGGDRAGQRLSMAQAAYQWKRSNQEAEYILSNLKKSQWTEVSYEGYCRNPDATLSRLFHFLDLDPEKRIQDFRAARNHVVGNGMRLDATSQVILDERWREVLTDSDLRIFDRVAGKLNRKYGYL